MGTTLWPMILHAEELLWTYVEERLEKGIMEDGRSGIGGKGSPRRA
ncbi:hypothetical protein [Candidatus Methylacidithermus pantelleriae]|uniref:Uncharacterized protein n=1 Tax=Candidatus Methylacidithermus pantelleriae TaxID=2744239 RepID=A0A8J2FNA4_9BACT|nr:hypothetical protein [Candidatus Methylacidithermus pantelleriae]CAF0694461.1 hypothetical protein MPNT_160061 [Candidatus Methylacidithermus pantelleriae]